jgi:lipopolysaccharide transport system ATP-binding protein
MEQDTAIEVEGLSKRFRIGLLDDVHDSIGASILSAIKSPLKNYRKYRSLYKFDSDENNGARSGDTSPADIIWALRDINFKVPRGQVLGIIGSNGAGKSTLLKVLSGITPPTHGRVTIRGRVSSLLEVGTGFHQELTGRENVYLNGTMLGMSKKEMDKRFDSIVEFSGVDKFLDTPVKRYSSGMRVRLAFAVAAHLEPEVLIIDEVLAVGDAAFQRKSLSKMEDVSQHGRTVLFVSHNMPAITRLCSRAILLDQGALTMDGNATDVVGAYLNQGHGMAGVREWPDESAPGDGAVRLRRLRVKNSSGQTAKAIDIQDSIGLEMEYEVLEGGRRLMPHFTVWSQEGIRLFPAVETDPAWMHRSRPAGRYITTAWIRGNLLNEGMLYVSALMKTVEPFERHFNAHQQVAFQVVDSMKKGSARGEWVGGIEGAFRPKLDWETTVCAATDSVGASVRRKQQ